MTLAKANGTHQTCRYMKIHIHASGNFNPTCLGSTLYHQKDHFNRHTDLQPTILRLMFTWEIPMIQTLHEIKETHALIMSNMMR